MEPLFGHCLHEHMTYGKIWWTDAEESGPVAVILCADCDLMMCSIPDYFLLTSKEPNGLVNY